MQNSELKPLVSIVIPAFNEEKNIGKTIDEVKKLQDRYRLDIIVVDDGSQDKTAQVAKKQGVTVIRLPKNRGKGAAFRAGIDRSRGEYIIQIDADLQFLPEQIPDFIDALQRDDIVVGSRFNKGSREAGSVSLVNLFGNWLMSITTTIFSGVAVTDIMAGFKGMRSHIAKQLDLQTPHFGYEAEIIVKAGKHGFSVRELPIHYRRRRIGSSNVHPIQDGLRVSTTIMRLYFAIPGQQPGHGTFGVLVKTVLGSSWIVLGLWIASFLTIQWEGIPGYTAPFFSAFIEKIWVGLLLVTLLPWVTGSFLSGLFASIFFSFLRPSAVLTVDTAPALWVPGILAALFIVGKYVARRHEPRLVHVLSAVSGVTIAACLAQWGGLLNLPVLIMQLGTAITVGIVSAIATLTVIDFSRHKDSLISLRRIMLFVSVLLCFFLAAYTVRLLQ